MADFDTVVAQTPVPDGDEPAGRPTPNRYIGELITYVVAIVVALLLGGAVFLLMGADPLAAYATIIDSSMGSLGGAALALNKTVPLILGSAAVAFAMRAGYLNLGVDGQIYMGAIFATGVAFALPGVPRLVAVPLVVVAAAIGGGIFGFIPAILRQRWGVNELFVTVMLNFVGFYLVDWVATGPWTDPMAGEALTRPIAPSWDLPRLFESAHIGIIIAIAIAVFMSWWLNSTRQGFEFRAAGINPTASLLGGVRLYRIGIVALVVSGMVAGIAGGFELTGVHGRMITGFSHNFGYMSVLAAVLARRSPIFTVPVALGFGMLLLGSDALQRTISLPSPVVLMFQALVVLSVLFFDAIRTRRAGSRASRSRS